MTTTIEKASILTAFDEQTIGSKVVWLDTFMSHLMDAVDATDFEDQRVPGQAFIPMVNEKALASVSAGVGKHTQDPSDYVKRLYRDKVRLFLSREHAAPVESLAVVVYTRDAYLDDPDVQADEAEYARIENSGATHVLVAVLASAGPEGSPLSPGRLVNNLAGGNKEALEWDADEIRAKAREATDYYSEWTTVAD